MISYQSKTFLSFKNVFLRSYKTVSSINSTMGSVRPRTFARTLATCRNVYKSIEEYLLGRVKFYQIYHIAVYVFMLFRNVTIFFQIISFLCLSHSLALLFFKKVYLYRSLTLIRTMRIYLLKWTLNFIKNIKSKKFSIKFSL